MQLQTELLLEQTRPLEAIAEELRRSNRKLQDFASVALHNWQEPPRKIKTFGDRLVSRAGPGRGAEFTVELPLAPPTGDG